MTKKTVAIAALALSGALVLSACGGSADVEVDRSTPESAAVSIIHLTASEQFDEACEISSSNNDSCLSGLAEAFERWSGDEPAEGSSLLQMAHEITTESVEHNEVDETIIVSIERSGLARDHGDWRGQVGEDPDGHWSVDTSWLSD